MLYSDYHGVFDVEDLMDPEIPDGMWASKDGRLWDISEMETSHILNTIRFLKRSHLLCGETDGKIEQLQRELDSRGEGGE